MSEKPQIWNPFVKGYFENPDEFLRVWREDKNPVQKGINDCWMLFKYEDVKFLLTAPVFKTWKTHESVEEMSSHLDASENFDELSKVFSKVLLFMDPPEQTELRSVITKVWNSQLWEQSVYQAIETALQALAGKDRAELVADYARVVPTLVISKILGLPEKDYPRITNWSHQFIKALEPFISLYGLRQYNQEALEFYEYLVEVIELKKKEPDDLFISRLLAVNETLPESLSRDQIISVLCMLFFAGIETSVNLLSQSILLLLKDPEQAALARATKQLSAAAANELIRYVSPVNYTKRVATEDVEIRGRKIAAGEPLLGAIISANFDADVFETPEQLDLERVSNPHLGFGHGSHFCLGAKLGREQLSRSLPALFRRYPNLALSGETKYQWDKLVMNRALKSLPVTLIS